MENCASFAVILKKYVLSKDVPRLSIAKLISKLRNIASEQTIYVELSLLQRAIYYVMNVPVYS